ncbi:MAG: RNA polymerase sigma factor [Sandaracinaceae bacterium]|nr:RNA polymerase sigma factor [Sandaracinaceae bacterium]
MDGSFDALFEREVGYVHRTLLRLGVHARDVEDGVQEVFLAVHKKWGECDRSRPIRPWLFAFVHHYAANYRRLGRHRHTQGDAELVSTDSPEHAVAQAQARALLLRALDALPDERRAIFVACDIDEMPPPEVARALEIPLGTVYSRLRTAREELAHAARRLIPPSRPPEGRGP